MKKGNMFKALAIILALLLLCGIGTVPVAAQEAYQKQITPTKYTDDFEDETQGANPSHWVERNIYDDWRVLSQDGSKVYGAVSDEKAMYTWLHGFETDVTLKARFKSDCAQGKIGFVTRMYDVTVYVAVGYDVASQKWFMASRLGGDEDEQIIYADAATPLKAKTWHDIEITTAGSNVTAKVDGERVLAVRGVENTVFGRMGAFTHGAAMYIDDVEITCPNGTDFTEGVVEYTVDKINYLNTLEVEDLGDGNLFAIHSDRAFLSADAGQTLTPISEDSPYTAAIAGSGYTTLYPLGQNRWLRVAPNMVVSLSEDGLKSWAQVGRVLSEADRVDEQGRAAAIFHVNSMTGVPMPDGHTRLFMPIAWRLYNKANSITGHYVRIFYSDDEGKTWQESQNDSRDLIPTYKITSPTYAEGKVIACADGAVRYYQTRNISGSTMYMESVDGGVTWSSFGKIPYIQNPVGSFGIAQDPEAPGTYYMAAVNDVSRALSSILPRTRLSLYKTTDGKNWSFVTDIDRSGKIGNSYDKFQFLDPSVTVVGNYIYVTYGHSTAFAQGAHNNQRARFVRLEKDKLTTRGWDDATVADTTFPLEISVAGNPKTKFKVGESFTTQGLQVQVTAINGQVTTQSADKYSVVQAPDTSTPGTYTVTLLSEFYMTAQYTVTVAPDRTPLFIGLGVGGALLVGAVVFLLLYRNRKNNQ